MELQPKDKAVIVPGAAQLSQVPRFVLWNE